MFLRQLARRKVDLFMAFAFLLGGAIAASRLLDASELARVASAFRLWGVLPLLLLPVLFLLLKARRFYDLFKLKGGAPRRPTIISYLSAQLATMLPGGFSARILLMQESAGRGKEAIVPTFLDKFLDLILLGLVALWASWQYPQVWPLTVLFCLGLVALAGWCRTQDFKDRSRAVVETLAWRLGWKVDLAGAFGCSRPSASLATLVALQTLAVLGVEIAMLWVSFRALGLAPEPAVLVLAYTASDLLGRIAPTPGGVAVTEAGMVAVLTQLTGMSVNEAAAGTFLFRLTSFVLPAAYGAFCYTYLWRSRWADRPSNYRLARRGPDAVHRPSRRAKRARSPLAG